MSTSVCDTLGAPVPHQQVVVVGVIVHTDEETPVVRIPAYAPLYQHLNKQTKPPTLMQTDGIPHVSTEWSERFVGVALDAFTAVHSRGDESNQMSVAISGLISAPMPITEMGLRLDACETSRPI